MKSAVWRVDVQAEGEHVYPPRRGGLDAERWDLFSELSPEQFSSSWLKWMPIGFDSWKPAYYISAFRCVYMCVHVFVCVYWSHSLKADGSGKEFACNVGDLG